MNGLILRILTFSDEITFWILIVLFLYKFVTGYGPVQGVDSFRRILGVSDNTWPLTLHS
jgi:hypothetical protein